MKTRAGNFLLVVASTILALLLAEFLVRVFLPQDKMVTWIEMHPRGFMMNQSNINAIHHFDDRRLRYQFNEIGLRGDKDFQKGKTNILLLGDSFTFGLLLKEEDTYASILQEKLSEQIPDQQFQILNGAVGGAGLADWPAWLKHNEKFVNPDVVILYLNYMDVDRAISKNLFIVNDDSTLTDSIRWKPRTLFISLGRMGWYRWLQEHSELMNIAVKVAWRYLYFSDQTENFSQEYSKVLIPSESGFDPNSGYSVQLAKLLTERIRSWCEKNNCKFILSTTGFFGQNSSGRHTYAYYNTLKNDSNNDLIFFDNYLCVKEKVNGDFDSIRIPEDSHPNEKGAEIIAECSMSWLEPFLKQ